MATPGIRDPFGTQSAPRRQDQEGDTRNGGRFTYRNGEWVETNNVRQGQTATLNGQTVVADGKGNWQRVRQNPQTGNFESTNVGTYEQGVRYGPQVEMPSFGTPTSTPTPTPPAAAAAPASSSDANDGRMRGAGTPDVAPPPAAGPPQPTERTNANGIVQRGVSLSSANELLAGLGIGEVRDLSTMYQSNALPATVAGITQVNKPLVEDATPTQKPDVSDPFQPNPQLQGNLPEGTTSFAPTDSYTRYSAGVEPTDARDGASPQPDIAESKRQLSPNSRSFNGADFSGEEPDNSSLVSPMYANKNRNRIRSAFLDTSKNSMEALRASEREAGIFQQGGKTFGNVNGELKEVTGDAYAFRNAAMSGVDPSEFLQTKLAEVKGASEGTPTAEDTPTAPTSAVATPGLTPEEQNAEYAAIKFVLDPETNMMMPAK